MMEVDAAAAGAEAEATTTSATTTMTDVAAPPSTWQCFYRDANNEKVIVTLKAYSEEERIWLIEQVRYELSDKIGKDGGFTYYNDADAKYMDAELKAISDAVFRDFDQCIYHSGLKRGKFSSRMPSLMT
jgi:hypothetical protein